MVFFGDTGFRKISNSLTHLRTFFMMICLDITNRQPVHDGSTQMDRAIIHTAVLHSEVIKM